MYIPKSSIVIPSMAMKPDVMYAFFPFIYFYAPGPTTLVG